MVTLFCPLFSVQINRKIRGKTAVHVACTEGYIGCLRCLLFYHPDLEVMVRPLALLTISSFSCVEYLI